MQKDKEPILDSIGKVMLLARGFMAIFYLGLIWIVFVLIYKFIITTIDLTYATLVTQIDKTALIIKVLQVIDLVMVSQLVWVVALAGFSLFVSSNYFDSHQKSKPDWLDHVNTYSLKLKLSFSIISISGVHALRVYLENNSITMDVVYAALIHLVFVLSAIGIALSMKLVNQNQNTSQNK
jgi:uncharacterized protein (TIGR00645 family)